MTIDREELAKIARKHFHSRFDGIRGGFGHEGLEAYCFDYWKEEGVLAAMQEAVAETIERCAKICDNRAKPSTLTAILQRKAHVTPAEEAAQCALEIRALPHEPVESQYRKDAELRKKYEELIYAVCCKFTNESRHETALRYIRERETREVPPAADAARALPGEGKEE